jgi:hypothetical protein
VGLSLEPARTPLDRLAMPFVIDGKTGETKPVTNLGWLLKHWQEVERFVIRKQLDGTALMVAELGEARLYVIEWASFEVCIGWLARPSFDGVEVVEHE